MNEGGESDRSVLPEKQPNNGDAEAPPAEAVEGRDLTKGKSPQQNACRTQSRDDAHSALEAIRKAAKANKEMRFSALLHHVYNIDALTEVFYSLKRNAAAGVDGQTWERYEESLAGNLQDLSERLRSGAYRAKPVKRVYVPKSDGRQRPIGVPALEDKIVQKAMAGVLNAI
jgi:RNA-directed DNA polymerase